jgi:hypothetical protein
MYEEYPDFSAHVIKWVDYISFTCGCGTFIEETPKLEELGTADNMDKEIQCPECNAIYKASIQELVGDDQMELVLVNSDELEEDEEEW